MPVRRVAHARIASGARRLGSPVNRMTPCSRRIPARVKQDPREAVTRLKTSRRLVPRPADARLGDGRSKSCGAENSVRIANAFREAAGALAGDIEEALVGSKLVEGGQQALRLGKDLVLEIGIDAF